METERWKQLGDNAFAVEIAKETSLSAVSLMHFMRRIPFAIRKNWKKFEWAGDYDEDGKRFGIIVVEMR